MANIKWSAFPSATSTTGGDVVVGLHSGANTQFVVSATAAASAIALWDANSNLSGNNLLSGFATTATAAGTTVLTVASKRIQEFTGSTTQTVTMPVTSTLAAGQSYTILNNSSGAVTVNSSGGNAIQVMAANSTLIVTCVLTSGTTAASWNGTYIADGGGVLSITGTANQVIASAATGAITLSLPQSIGTSNTPQFAGAYFGSPTGPQATTAGTVQVVGLSGNQGSVLTSSYVNSSGASPTFWAYKSRSTTVGAFTTVQTGDTLGRLLAFSDDGTSFVQSASIVFQAEGTVSTGIVPGKIVFGTANSSGSVTTGLSISSAQLVTAQSLFSNTTIQAASSIASGQTTGGTAGNLTLYSPTASQGSMGLLAVNNGGNFANVLTHASTAAARTWTLPDASGTIALTSGASGIVNSGTQNQLTWYAGTGTTVSGLATANSGVLVTGSTGVPVWSSTMTNGQVIIGSTGATPVAASLTAGTNITITPGAGTITIASTAAGTVNSGTQNQLAYYAANGTTVSGLTSANNGLLVTSAAGVPSIGNAILADITVNGIKVGLGGTSTSTTNTAIGLNVLNANSSGTGNTVGGASSLTLCTGSTNTAWGTGNGPSISTGSNNILLGNNNAGTVGSATALTTGTDNIFIGDSCGTDSASAGDVIAIGVLAIANAATGATSSDNGASFALGSASHKVGFRGDGSIYPSAGTSAGFFRIKLNGTFYKILLMADS